MVLLTPQLFKVRLCWPDSLLMWAYAEHVCWNGSGGRYSTSENSQPYLHAYSGNFKLDYHEHLTQVFKLAPSPLNITELGGEKLL